MDGEKKKSGSKARTCLVRVLRLLPPIVSCLLILSFEFPLARIPGMRSAPEPILFAAEEWDAVIRWGMIPLLGLLVLATALLDLGAVLFRRKLSTIDRIILTTVYLAAVVFGFICMNTCCISHQESHERVMCSAHLKALAMSLSVYADESGGNYPPDLETLKKSDILGNLDIRCPIHGSPAYEYYGRGRSAKEAPFIIIEDRLRNHKGGYRNFVRTDFSRGHRRGR